MRIDRISCRRTIPSELLELACGSLFPSKGDNSLSVDSAPDSLSAVGDKLFCQFVKNIRTFAPAFKTESPRLPVLPL